MRSKFVLGLSLLIAASAHAAPEPAPVEIDVKSTAVSFTARVPHVDLTVPAGGLETGKPSVLRFDFASIKTGNATRDRDMVAWEETARFPEVKFTLLGIDRVAGQPPLARGRLQLHGVERPMSFPISIEQDKQGIKIDGETTLDTRDFGLPVIKEFVVLKVNPILRIHFHVRTTAAKL